MKALFVKKRIVFVVLLVLLFCVALFSIQLGAVKISTSEIIQAILKIVLTKEKLNLNENIFIQIRLPRVLLGMVVGAILSVAGVVMQAVFRNPIVEPGMLGTSSGAALGASCYFVIGSKMNPILGDFSLPFYASIGAILATLLVLKLSTSPYKKEGSIVTLLLVGVAVNALSMSGVGFLSYLARDPQARSINFWNLGTLSGANWSSFFVCLCVAFFCIGMIYNYHKELNSLLLGDNEAYFLGVDLEKLKIIILFFNVIMVAVATAFVGVISFVGLIIPHLLRLVIGADNKGLILYSAVLGAIFLCSTDLISRIILQPSELPIGIFTAIIGVPIFIILLKKNNYLF